MAAAGSGASSGGGPDWEGLWKDIEGGGALRWRTDQEEAGFKAQVEELRKHGVAVDGGDVVFAPMCGDAPFLTVAAAEGATVVGVDLSATGLAFMRKRFGVDEEAWKSGEDATLPYRELAAEGGRGRVRLYEGDVCAQLAEEVGTCTVWYDKDALGALPSSMHAAYKATAVSYFHKEGCLALMSGVRRKAGEEGKGPPFHFPPETALMTEEAAKAGFKTELVDTLVNTFNKPSNSEAWDNITYVVRYVPTKSE